MPLSMTSCQYLNSATAIPAGDDGNGLAEDTIQLRPMPQVAALYAGDLLLARIILRWCSDETDQEAGGSSRVLARVVAPTCGTSGR